MVKLSKLSKKKDKPEMPTAESSLAPQLGTDREDLQKGRIDMRRFSKLGPLDKAWISYFLLLEDEEGGEFMRAFCSNWLNLATSEDGWRTNKTIQAIAASQGAPGVGELVKKPGFVGRHITNRDWKRKADEEGKTIVE